LHRDSLDRLVAAQAQALGIPMVTAGPKLKDYWLQALITR
jgi:PIN domain nuclease of toxin-antitoxin system